MGAAAVARAEDSFMRGQAEVPGAGAAAAEATAVEGHVMNRQWLGEDPEATEASPSESRRKSRSGCIYTLCPFVNIGRAVAGLLGCGCAEAVGRGGRIIPRIFCVFNFFEVVIEELPYALMLGELTLMRYRARRALMLLRRCLFLTPRKQQ